MLRCLVVVIALVIGVACEDAPPPSAAPGEPVSSPSFELVVIGDFGDGSSAEGDVAEAVHDWTERNGTDALVTTGDNVYEDGEPDDFGAAWEDPYGWVKDSGLEIVASLGNHDIRTDDGKPVMELLEMPDRWYEITIGDAQLFVLDANRPENEDQLAWMRDALADTGAPWRIAVFHQPAYSCSRHGGEQDVVDAWVPMFEQDGVDLVLNGHDHNYQRFASTNGVSYVVSGGGGNSTLYALENCPAGYPQRVAGDDDRHHFLALEGNQRRLRVRAVAADGSVIDDFTLRAP